MSLAAAKTARRRLPVSRPWRPDFSASGMNSLGGTKAALRMLPAGEGFEAAEKAGAKLDERLKIRDDLVIFEGSAQIVRVVGGHGKRRYYGDRELHSKFS